MNVSSVLLRAARSPAISPPQVQNAVMACDGIVSDEVQRFSLFDASGRSLKDQWETLIADATKRLGGPDDNRCRVTVTDRFGGRGHDYQVTTSPDLPLISPSSRPRLALTSA